MKHLTTIGNAILDSAFAWFTPSWRRKGHEALSSITRYLNHFAPKIKQENAERLHEVQDKLRNSLDTWDKEATVQATAELENIGEGIPDFKRNPLAEMVESFFVIMVVFMGIRTYYTQPFRIPTGSMQPSLNGIIIHPVEEIPSAPKRWWDAVTLGSSYVEATAENTKAIVGLKQSTKWMFFTETIVSFDDGSRLSIPCAQGAVAQYFEETGKLVTTSSGKMFLPFRQGETIIRARVDAGDMVFVNRMAYHFRKPVRGETFVFDTRGIKTRESVTMLDQSNGTHYIKRLCGLPGDTLEIRDPQLIVNGQVAQEPTIRRVMAGQASYNREGYQALDGLLYPQAFIKAGRTVTLNASADDANLREYAALGDNTTNSLDSRYWGPVRQFNVLGPASFTLWPFSSHWGGIE